jgi:hypothetical protein
VRQGGAAPLSGPRLRPPPRTESSGRAIQIVFPGTGPASYSLDSPFPMSPERRSKRIQIGVVGVDSARLVITDPSYIKSQWSAELTRVDDRNAGDERSPEVAVLRTGAGSS